MIADNTYRTTKQVFDSLYGDDKSVSRPQAKRLLAEIDKFKTVILDFEAVETSR